MASWELVKSINDNFPFRPTTKYIYNVCTHTNACVRVCVLKYKCIRLWFITGERDQWLSSIGCILSERQMGFPVCPSLASYQP